MIELVVERSDKYTIEKLQGFCLEFQQTTNDQVASEEEEKTEEGKINQPYLQVKDILKQGTGIYGKNQLAKLLHACHA